MISPFLVYMFLKRLVTPFDQWEAFKTGVIDAKGNVLIKAKDRKLMAQRDSFTMWDRLCLNIKRTLAMLPGGSTRIATYAAALYLLRETSMFKDGKGLIVEGVNTVDMDKLKLFVESAILNEIEGTGPVNVANPDDTGGWHENRHFLDKKDFKKRNKGEREENVFHC